MALHVLYVARHPALAHHLTDAVVKFRAPKTPADVTALKELLIAEARRTYKALRAEDEPVEIVLHSWRELDG